jgi:hypothetical protein
MYYDLDSKSHFQGINLLMFCFKESKFAIFLYPGVVYVDRGLLPMTVVERDAGEFGKHPTLVGFSGHKVTNGECSKKLAHFRKKKILLHSTIIKDLS